MRLVHLFGVEERAEQLAAPFHQDIRHLPPAELLEDRLHRGRPVIGGIGRQLQNLDIPLPQLVSLACGPAAGRDDHDRRLAGRRHELRIERDCAFESNTIRVALRTGSSDARRQQRIIGDGGSAADKNGVHPPPEPMPANRASPRS